MSLFCCIGVVVPSRYVPFAREDDRDATGTGLRDQFAVLFAGGAVDGPLESAERRAAVRDVAGVPGHLDGPVPRAVRVVLRSLSGSDSAVLPTGKQSPGAKERVAADTLEKPPVDFPVVLRTGTRCVVEVERDRVREESALAVSPPSGRSLHAA
ncbi:MAG: hypothetical protein V5A44_09760 [Haloarculaceae archaeon]